MHKMNVRNIAGMVRVGMERGVVFSAIMCLSILSLFPTIGNSQITEFETLEDGILIPRVDRTAVTNPIQTQLLWDINTESFWYYNNGIWVEISNSTNLQSLIMDQDNDTSVDVEESPDSDAIVFKLANQSILKIENNPYDCLLYTSDAADE